MVFKPDLHKLVEKLYEHISEHNKSKFLSGLGTFNDYLRVFGVDAKMFSDLPNGVVGFNYSSSDYLYSASYPSHAIFGGQEQTWFGNDDSQINRADYLENGEYCTQIMISAKGAKNLIILQRIGNAPLKIIRQPQDRAQLVTTDIGQIADSIGAGLAYNTMTDLRYHHKMSEQFI
ncbi:MAG: hypothetical protein AABW92_00675 [Nanoarchaeota archaeon]